MASAAVSALNALLLAGIVILLIRSGSTGDVHLTWKTVLWLVLFAGVAGSLFRDEWQRPDRKVSIWSFYVCCDPALVRLQ